MIFMATKKVGQKSFSPTLLVLLLDPGSRMDKNQYPGSGINMPDPQHCGLEVWWERFPDPRPWGWESKKLKPVQFTFKLFFPAGFDGPAGQSWGWCESAGGEEGGTSTGVGNGKVHYVEKKNMIYLKSYLI